MTLTAFDGTKLQARNVFRKFQSAGRGTPASCGSLGLPSLGGR